MNLPPCPEPGSPVSAEWARQLIAALASTRLFADGAGQLPGGTVLDPPARRPQPAASAVVGDANLPDLPCRSVERDHGAGSFGLADFATAPAPSTEDSSKLRILVREEYDVPDPEGGDPTTACRLKYMEFTEYPEY